MIQFGRFMTIVHRGETRVDIFFFSWCEQWNFKTNLYDLYDERLNQAMTCKFDTFLVVGHDFDEAKSPIAF